MKSLWLIANSKSQTTDAETIASVQRVIEARGTLVSRLIDLVDEGLPGADATHPDIVASLGGDGTANAVIERFGQDSGPELLILPGGTMNLLAARLHGEKPVEDIVEAVLPQGTICSLPQIEGPRIRSLVGIIAGATALWGDVREDLRSGAVGSLIESVPRAVDSTFNGDGIQLAGVNGNYAAIYVDPGNSELNVHEIKVDNLGDLVRHGFAWAQREFLGGPVEKLMEDGRIIIDGDADQLDLLVDGERRSASLPLELCWSRCPARFLVAKAG